MNLLTDDVLDALKAYSWPGNVRELKHVIERMVVTAKGTALTPKDLPKEIRENKAPRPSAKPVLSKAQAEKENIQRAIVETQGNRSRAAEILGITRKTLFNKMKKYDLENS